VRLISLLATPRARGRRSRSPFARVGSDTEEIARAVVRPTGDDGAKARAGEAKMPMPASLTSCRKRAGCPSGAKAVLTVSTWFQRGYAAKARRGRLLPNDLSAEAISLARVVRALTSPDPPTEATGSWRSASCRRAVADARIDERATSSYSTSRIAAVGTTAQISEAVRLVDTSDARRAWTLLLASSHRRGARPSQAKGGHGRKAILRLFRSPRSRIQPSAIVTTATARSRRDGRRPLPRRSRVGRARERRRARRLPFEHAARADSQRRTGGLARLGELPTCSSSVLATTESEGPRNDGLSEQRPKRCHLKESVRPLMLRRR